MKQKKKKKQNTAHIPKRLSFFQTLQLAWYAVPSSRGASLAALAGVLSIPVAELLPPSEGPVAIAQQDLLCGPALIRRTFGEQFLSFLFLRWTCSTGFHNL